jgi:hypothetical protein
MLSRAPLVIMIGFGVVSFAPDEYFTVFVGCSVLIRGVE